ncbi:hypothetical protein EDE08_12113 [Bradyrhizobium sp. R2.2-H]|nr:hypothetical protein EDE10_12553 [Bradyrhizobium sp. Y-H1]TCU64727.1 hypothetical protein EDE08_12113 [Bradyrhizobium sp. R2.2-H]
MVQKTELSSASGRPLARPRGRQTVDALRKVRRASSNTRRPRNTPDLVQSCPSKFADLAIQLLLDPAVFRLRYIRSISYQRRQVPVEMLVAELGSGRVAFDIVDERPSRDIDEEGLLLLALAHHKIRLIEIDCAGIDEEPRAENCRRIWSHRNYEVPPSHKTGVVRALAKAPHRHLSIRSLSNSIRVRDPMNLVCALISQGVLAIDLTAPLTLDSIVGPRSDRQHPLPLSAAGLGRFGIHANE